MAKLQHPLDIASTELRQFGRHRDLEERVSTLERKGGSGGGPGSPGPPGAPGLVHRGAWNAATAYTQNDAVTYEGSYFRRKVFGTTSTAPDEDAANWELIAEKGDPGAKGDQGDQGEQGIQGPKGDTGDTGLPGADGEQGPKGDKGDTGIQGIQGATGAAGLVHRGTWAAATAYAVNDSVVYSGESFRRKVAGTTATIPTSDTTNWERYAIKGTNGAAGLVWRGAWVAATNYAINNAVVHDGQSFRRLIAGVFPTAPPDDPTRWELLAAKGAQGIQGPKGDTGDTGAQGSEGPAGPIVPVNDLSTTTGDLDMEGFKVIDLGTPTSATDVANKQYVDAQVATKPSIWSVTLEELDAAEWSTDGWTTPLSGLDGDLIPGMILIPIFDHLPYGVADLTVHERPTIYGGMLGSPVGVDWGIIWTGSDVSLYIQVNPASIQTSDTLYEIVVIGKSA